MPKNTPSPYRCRNLNGLQSFTTDQGVEYAMGFTNVSHYLSPVLGIYDIRVYTFDFFSDGHGSKDERVAATIQNEVEGFFTDPNRVLTYICDSGDGLQAERQRLFTQWTRNMEDVKHAKVQIGEELYGGILMRKDFRHWDVLQEELFHRERGFGAKFGT